MLRTFISFTLLGIVALAPTGRPVRAAESPAPASVAAPADRYFGPMHLSPLGIRDRIDVLGRRYHERTISDNDLVHDAKLAESALDDWQRRYPRDPWMIPTFYHLEQLYQTVQSTNARAHATALLHFIANTYPASKEGHLSRLRLAQGFAPLVAESQTQATPDPYSHSPAPASSAPASSAPVSSAPVSSAPVSSAPASSAPAPTPRATAS